MKKIIKRIWFEISITNVFRKYRYSLPTESNSKTPKMNYHVLADAVVWSDEGIEKCNPELGNMLRNALHYRTKLIVEKGYTNPKTDRSFMEKRAFIIAKRYFPNWVGFNTERCTYSIELSKRINRIRKVSDWKIEKMTNDLS